MKRSFNDTKNGALHPGVTDKEARDIYSSMVWESFPVILQLAFKKPKVNPKKVKIPLLIFSAQLDELVKPPWWKSCVISMDHTQE